MATHPIPADIEIKTVTQVAGRPAELLTFAAEGSGVPVLFHLTTPSVPLPFFWVSAPMRETMVPGIRPITYLRPGYEHTERRGGRTVADAAADTAAVLDAWGLDKVVMYGGSGGGPHALACAALIPDRVAGLVIDGCPAPFELVGPDALDGMLEINRIGHEMAMQETGDLLDKMRAVFDPSVPAGDDEIVRRARESIAAGGLPVGATPEAMAAFLESGGPGWADDVMAITKPWGFGLADVKVPATIYIGSRDELAPPAHGRFLARHISGATPRHYDGGHGALAERLHEVVQELVTKGKELT